MNMFQDQNGGWSSKRIIGAILLSIGAVMLSTGGFLSLFQVLKDAITFISVGKVLMATGGGLLGVGVFEFFKSKKEVDKK